MKGKLKSINMFSILVQGLIGIRILTLPRDVIKYAKSDSWISMIIMYGITLLTAYTFYWISMQYKGLDFSQINVAVLGKFFGRLTLIPFILYGTLTIGLSLRLFAYSIRIFLLDKTPIIVVMSLALISCVYCLKKDIKTISILMDIFLPVVLISCLLLVILPIASVDPGNLLPVLHRGIKPVLMGTLQIIDPILPSGIIAFIMPYFEETKSIKKHIFWAITVSSLIYLSIITISLMIFGSNEINYILYPTLTLTKSIQSKSIILERAESFFMVSWIPITVTTLVINYFACTLSIKTFFNTKKDNLIIFAQLPVFLIIALIPQNIVELLKYLDYNAILALSINFLYLPFFTSMVYFMVRRKRSK
ncbi:MAG: spore germination protein [Clostridiales bacterium]|jgi:spore germination protein (amino acid permease)|nr:spore germination protein [Clostridiales bacterium]